MLVITFNKNIIFFTQRTIFVTKYNPKKLCIKLGLVRDLNPGPLAPEARIIPLDQRANCKIR